MRLAYVTPNATLCRSASAQGGWSWKQTSDNIRLLASDSGPDRVFNLKNHAMTKLENRCANCGGRSCQLSPLGHALLPEVLQGQLPSENSEGPCAHEKMVWLLNSRHNLTPLSIIAPFPADATQESQRSTYLR